MDGILTRKCVSFVCEHELFMNFIEEIKILDMHMHRSTHEFEPVNFTSLQIQTWRCTFEYANFEIIVCVGHCMCLLFLVVTQEEADTSLGL